MTIAKGDRIPDVQVKVVTDHGAETVSSADVLGHGRVVLFGVPAAFSPTCSDVHLPGFVVRADDLLGKGIDRIVCVSVNDPYVMAAWGRSQQVGTKVTMLADGNGDLARAMGTDIDLSAAGMGLRNKRYAVVIDDGTVTHVALEERTGLEVSSADAVLALLG
jgi:peroxiredoxin